MFQTWRVLNLHRTTPKQVYQKSVRKAINSNKAALVDKGPDVGHAADTMQWPLLKIPQIGHNEGKFNQKEHVNRTVILKRVVSTKLWPPFAAKGETSRFSSSSSRVTTQCTWSFYSLENDKSLEALPWTPLWPHLFRDATIYSNRYRFQNKGLGQRFTSNQLGVGPYPISCLTEFSLVKSRKQSISRVGLFPGQTLETLHMSLGSSDPSHNNPDQNHK